MRIYIYFILIFAFITSSSYAQVYEEVRISEEEKAKARDYYTGLYLSGGFSLPIGGLKVGFSNGYSVELGVLHKLERIYLKASLSHDSYFGKVNVRRFDNIYTFNHLKSISYKFGILANIEISDKFSFMPGVEIGQGFTWHKRLQSSVSDPYTYGTTSVIYALPINFIARFNFTVSDRISVFVQPSGGLYFTFGLYSGNQDFDFSDFSAKEELLSFKVDLSAGFAISLRKK